MNTPESKSTLDGDPTSDLTIVIPIFLNEATIRPLFRRIVESLNETVLSYEVIYVDDGSPDNSWAVIEELCELDHRVRGIQLSRNFGQHYAITAGLESGSGRWFIVMDGDLQDRPEEIPNLLQETEKGFDLVVARRIDRQDHRLKIFGSWAFSKLLSFLAGVRLDNRVGNFGIYSRQVIQNVCSLREHNRSFGLIALWVGFKRGEIDVSHSPRLNGKSSYSLRKLITLGLNSVTMYSDRLLHVSVVIGLLLSIVALILAGWQCYSYFVWQTPVEGWRSLITAAFFSTGSILGAIGILGVYLGSVSEAVKQRPLYIVRSRSQR